MMPRRFLTDAQPHNSETTILMSLAESVKSTPYPITIDGHPLSIEQLTAIAAGRSQIQLTDCEQTKGNIAQSVSLVEKAVAEGWSVYGVTTGFGGMANVPVPLELASASQNNLLSFLSTGAGNAIDIRHTRAAMALRANVLMQGCSGVRLELIQRIVDFLNDDAIPVVCELGSIGASGDLVPLSAIARAITGHDPTAEVTHHGKTKHCSAVLDDLGLSAIQLNPKEGLALINGTSFSTAIAANCISQSQPLIGLSLAINALMMRGLSAQTQPFAPFVHQHKPHPGQIWTAHQLQNLLSAGANSTTTANRNSTNGRNPAGDGTQTIVQDRYSIRCFPQYFGPIVEGMARITRTVETEMNSVSDNPLISNEEGCFYQSGNFLGQYIGIAMDDLRKLIGLTVKHLDVQIATLVAPEFNQGLPASLRGNENVPYNMGLKGLQITGNSIQPLLAWYANPIVDHFPTHAEQFNQNINGLSWGSANLAWKSVELFQHYICVSLVFAVQAIDLRCRQLHGHSDGRQLLCGQLLGLYNAVYQCLAKDPGNSPLVFDDSDQAIQDYLKTLYTDVVSEGLIADSIDSLLVELSAFSRNS
jgi:phenylalanine ammonia-lyase